MKRKTFKILAAFLTAAVTMTGTVCIPAVADTAKENKVTAEDLALKDGSYTVDVTMDGGTGRASIENPVTITVKDKKATASILWSSPNYDYMLVDEEKYTPVNTKGNSTFEIPVLGFDYKMPVTADTIAMSTPHEIEYTLQFDSATIKEAKSTVEEAK